ncbi:MAG: hypothetical protein MZV49_02830 [Rhodopseudomonas palustris]|nr:hypothetical protein [Rhodopseudomonas palustris]
MGALYKGLIATGVLSLFGVAGAIYLAGRLRPSHCRRRQPITGLDAVRLRRRRSGRHRPDHLDHRILHRHRLSPGAARSPRRRSPATAPTSSRVLPSRWKSTALPALVIVAGILVDLQPGRPVRHRDRGHHHARRWPA